MSRQTTHKIIIISKEKGEDGYPLHANYNAGIAYKAFDDGTLSIVLAPGIVLDNTLYKNYYINLKPIRQ
jgi:hypothetical protein